MLINNISNALVSFSKVCIGLHIASAAALFFQKYFVVPRLDQSEILKSHTYFYIQQRNFLDYVLLSIPIVNIAVVIVRHYTEDPVEAKMKEALLNIVKKNPEVLSYETAEVLSLTNDSAFMQTAIKNNPKALLYLKKDLAANLDFWIKAIKTNEEILSNLPLLVRKSEVFWFKLIVANPKFVDQVPSFIRSEKFYLPAIQANADVYSHLKECHQDSDFLIRAFMVNHGVLDRVDDHFSIYSALILLIDYNKTTFWSLPTEVQGNPAFRLALVKILPKFMQYFADESCEFYVQAMISVPSVICYLREREDIEELIAEAYHYNKAVLQYYRTTESLLLKLIPAEIGLLKGKYNLYMNPKFMLDAIKANPKAYDYLCWPLTENKSFMEEARAAKCMHIDCKSGTALI